MRTLYNKYSKEIPLQFQKIKRVSNYNVIACLCKSKEQREKIENHLAGKVELRRRFTCDGDTPISKDIYERLIALPTWEGLKPEKIIELIKEAIK